MIMIKEMKFSMIFVISFWEYWILFKIFLVILANGTQPTIEPLFCCPYGKSLGAQ